MFGIGTTKKVIKSRTRGLRSSNYVRLGNNFSLSFPLNKEYQAITSAQVVEIVTYPVTLSQPLGWGRETLRDFGSSVCEVDY